MPVNPESAIEVTAFNWVPPFAEGLVRDLRVRWALEEAGLDYRVRLLDARTPRPDDYFLDQPFGQVPSYRDEEVQLFESGAILLHLAISGDRLLPFDRAARMRSVAWMIAALNSVEPMLIELLNIDIFHSGEDWTKERRPQVVDKVRARLNRLADALGDREWLEGDRFTIGDLMMVTVLRILRHTQLVAEFPNLDRYVKRGEARPAFQAALADQIAAFRETENQKEGADA